MNGHQQFEADLDLYTLGTLEGEERQDLEAHLRTCRDCTRKLEEARGQLALLALAAPPTAPPARAKERLLERIRKRPGDIRQPVREPAVRFDFWRPMAPVFALAALTLAVLTTIVYRQNRELNHRLKGLQAAVQEEQARFKRAEAVLDVLTAPETVQVTLAASETHPVPQGKAFYHRDKGLLFYAANLPPLTREKIYQLWLIPTDGSPISAGIFQTDRNGNVEVVLPSLPSGVAAKAFAVTIEPAGGVLQPTGPKVLIGLVS